MGGYFEKISLSKYPAFLLGALFIFWVGFHFSALVYGTHNVPLHRAYIGDEGSPVNGALHILQQKSLLAVHNLDTLYYGPIFAVVAVPAVAGDFIEKYVFDGVRSADGYKNFIIYDWGGIIWKARLIALLTGFLGLVALYKILMTQVVNPKQQRLLALIGAGMLGLNFYYFEYATFFRHWIFVITALLWQLFFLVRMLENAKSNAFYYVYHTLLAGFAFGISYLSIFSQAIFLPLLYVWVRDKNFQELKKFCLYLLALCATYALIALWHPHALVRIFGIFANNVLGGGVNEYVLNGAPDGFSFWYYTKILFINHVALIGVLALTAPVLRNARSERKLLLWSVSLVGLVFYLALGLFSSHESRYALPMITMLVVFTSLVFMFAVEHLPRIRSVAVYTLLCGYFLYHVVTIGVWNTILWQDHPERAAIAEAVAYQSNHPESNQLMIGSTQPVGWPHSQTAVREYLSTFGLAESSLFQTYAVVPPATQYQPLRLYYAPTMASLPETCATNTYQRVILKVNSTPEIDYPEVNLVRYWTDKHTWQDQFFIVRED